MGKKKAVELSPGKTQRRETFSQDHAFRIDVVWDRLKLINNMKPALLLDGFRDNAAIQYCVLLHDMHIMDDFRTQTQYKPDIHAVPSGKLFW